MAYVPVPKDLTKVKSKFLFNLTKRQVICFGLGALVGVPKPTGRRKSCLPLRCRKTLRKRRTIRRIMPDG